MKRCFRLTGDQIDIEDLVFLLKGKDRRIYNEDGFYYYICTSINELSDSQVALEIANEEIHLLNGVAAINYNDHYNVTIDSYIEIDDKGNKHYSLMAEPLKGRSRLRATLATSAKVSNEISIHEEWLILSQYNQRVRDALHFFNDL